MRKFTEPYYEHYQKQWSTTARARDVPDRRSSDVDEVRIGFLGPDRESSRREARPHDAERRAAGHRRSQCARRLRRQAIQADGPQRPGDVGSIVSNEIVKMAYDEKVWAMLGSISGDSTHIGLACQLKTEVPIVNSAATDPTIPETIIPWYLIDHPGRPRAGLHACAADLYRPRPEAGRSPASQRPLRPVRRHQVQGRRRAGSVIPSSSSRSTCRATPISGAPSASSPIRAPKPSSFGGTRRRPRKSSSRCGSWA